VNLLDWLESQDYAETTPGRKARPYTFDPKVLSQFNDSRQLEALDKYSEEQIVRGKTGRLLDIDPDGVLRTRRPNKGFDPIPLIKSGGPGSGNFGHGGRPGEQGGSSPADSTSDDKAEKWTRSSDSSITPGSNPGGVYQDRNGAKHYVKFYGNTERMKSEQLANSIYRTLDINVPDTKLTEVEGKPAIASKLVESPEPMTRAQLAQNEEFLKGFVADAYLANHDVVGLAYDNVMSSNGAPYRIDNGGAMFYRAQGSPKSVFTSNPTSVPELDTMRNPSIAREAGKVFQGLDDNAVKSQAEKLVKTLTDTTLRRVIKDAGFGGAKAEKYFDILQGRRDGIAKRFGI
jgi:hypothetical protein